MPTPPPLPPRKPTPPPLPQNRVSPPPLPQQNRLPAPTAPSESMHYISGDHLSALKSLNDQHGGALNGRHNVATKALDIYHPDNPSQVVASYPVLHQSAPGARRVSVAAQAPPPVPKKKSWWFSREHLFAQPDVSFQEWAPPKPQPAAKPMTYVGHLDQKARRASMMDFHKNPSVQALIDHHKVNEPGIDRKEAMNRLHRAYEAFHMTDAQAAAANQREQQKKESEHQKLIGKLGLVAPNRAADLLSIYQSNPNTNPEIIKTLQAKLGQTAVQPQQKIGVGNIKKVPMPNRKPAAQPAGQGSPSQEQVIASRIANAIRQGRHGDEIKDLSKAPDYIEYLKKHGHEDAAKMLSEHHGAFGKANAAVERSKAALTQRQPVQPPPLPQRKPQAPAQSAFHYTGLDNSGQIVNGKVNAVNQEHAKQLIAKAGHFSPQFQAPPKEKKPGVWSKLESKLGNFFHKFETRGNKFLNRVGIPAPQEGEFSRS